MRAHTRWSVTVAAALAGLLAVSSAGVAVAAGNHAGAAAAHAAPATYRTEPGRLYHVAGTSWRDIWAVGLEPNSSLIEHFNGRTWSVSYDKPVGWFYGVAAVSPDDAWAVGGTNWLSPSQNLIMHWNGNSWREVPVPSPAGGGYLTSVAAVSATSAWAVGEIAPGGPGSPGAAVPLIEHWNGHRWYVQQFPHPVGGGEFNGVTATSTDNVWAVGATGSSSPNQALIEHWNGHKWSIVTTHAPPGGTYLQGVTAVSGHDAWAAGFIESANVVGLILHWNGYRWRVERSPNPTGNTLLWSVAATSHTNAWAVGYTNSNSCNPGYPGCESIILHWNGVRWAVTANPNPPSEYLNFLGGVFATSQRNAWAVGSTDFQITLIEHWNGRSWHD